MVSFILLFYSKTFKTITFFVFQIATDLSRFTSYLLAFSIWWSPTVFAVSIVFSTRMGWVCLNLVYMYFCDKIVIQMTSANSIMFDCYGLSLQLFVLNEQMLKLTASNISLRAKLGYPVSLNFRIQSLHLSIHPVHLQTANVVWSPANVSKFVEVRCQVVTCFFEHMTKGYHGWKFDFNFMPMFLVFYFKNWLVTQYGFF